METQKSKYKSLQEWADACPFLYNYARHRGFIVKVCKSFGWKEGDGGNYRGYWTKEKCKEEAKKYNSRSEWQRTLTGSYAAATKNKWLDECCLHMKILKLPNGYWTKERCIEESKKYNTKGEWSKNSPSSHAIAQANSWVKECSIHMVLLQRPHNYWTKERCIEEAKNYNTRNGWKRKGFGYHKAHINKWIEECCAHMPQFRKPNGYWTKERCIEDAKKYKIISEWRDLNESAYSQAHKNKYLEECCAHMPKFRKPNGYWTKERCIEEAKKYNSRSEWQNNSSSSFALAHRNNWLSECFHNYKNAA